jgi:hypothetical protein
VIGTSHCGAQGETKPGNVPPRTILAVLVMEIANPRATDEIKGIKGTLRRVKSLVVENDVEKRTVNL